MPAANQFLHSARRVALWHDRRPLLDVTLSRLLSARSVAQHNDKARLWLERGLWFGLPFGLLIISYVAICVEAGTAWPWSAFVHESGDKTLLDTFLYYDHAARELPVDIMLAAAAAAGLLAQGFRPRSVSTGLKAALLFAWVVSLTVIVLGTVDKVGWQGLADNLAQRFTRPGTPPAWGAHFRYHFLSRGGLVLTAWWLPGLLRWFTQEPRDGEGHRAYLAVLGLFAGLTLMYGPSFEPFMHPHFLGHQAREAVTHATVTLPLCLGIGLAVAHRPAPASDLGPRGRPARTLIVVAILSLTMVLWTGLGAMLTGASGERQTDSVVAIVAVHFFEHGLGYIFAPAFAGWLFCLKSQPAPDTARPPALLTGGN